MFKTLIFAAFVAGLLGGSAAAKEVAFDHGVLAETASELASPDKFIVAELFDEDGVKGESDDAQHEKSYW